MVFWKKLLTTCRAQAALRYCTWDMDLDFLPSWPMTLSYPLLFGALLVVGMMGGELARQARLPRVIGYVLVGFGLGPLAQAVSFDLIAEARIFVDLAVGLVLFDLGRRVDLQWMRRDWTLAASGLAESLLSFFAVFATFLALEFPAVEAGLAAAIAMTTSPAVLLLIVHDSRAEGQVTERAINLTALNGLLASIVTTIMLGSAHFESKVGLETALLHPLYLFIGSLLVGLSMAGVARIVARAVEKSRDVHFTLIAGLVVAAVGLATLLKLPVILALLSFGLFARNDQRGYDLLNVNLAPAGRLLYIVLFVITGASLPMSALPAAGWAALLFVLARALGKIVAVLAVAPIGGLRIKQAGALGLALLPMSSLALLMQHDISRLFPAFGQDLGAIFLAGVIVMEIVGPLAVVWGLRLAGESVTDLDRTGAYRAAPGPVG
jgi:Kef-type K+ transport system membrane component KefB